MRLLHIVSSSLIFVAAALALVTVLIGWGYNGDPDFATLEYQPTAMHGVSDNGREATYYSGDGLDDVDGIGLVRAGGTLLVLGATAGLLAALAYENSLLVEAAWVRTVGLSAAGLSTLLWIIGLILFPIGVSKVSETFGFFGDLTWSAGLYLGIVTTVLMLGGIVTHLVWIAQTTGFKLELADEGTAQFD